MDLYVLSINRVSHVQGWSVVTAYQKYDLLAIIGNKIFFITV